MANKKNQTNVQFLIALAKKADSDPMMQMVIVEAIGKYAKACANAKPEDFGEMGFICPVAWIAAAKRVNEAMEAKYGARA